MPVSNLFSYDSGVGLLTSLPFSFRRIIHSMTRLFYLMRRGSGGELLMEYVVPGAGEVVRSFVDKGTSSIIHGFFGCKKLCPELHIFVLGPAVNYYRLLPPIGVVLSNCGSNNTRVCRCQCGDVHRPCLHPAHVILDSGDVGVLTKRGFYVVSVIAVIGILERSLHLAESRIGYDDMQNDKSDSEFSSK